MHKAAGEAVQRARSGRGPTLIECRTYRLRPHAEGMPSTGYRTREEVEEWRARCPIESFGARLLSEGIANQEQLDQIDAEVAATIEEARSFADDSPWPDASTVADHLYSA